MKINIYIYTIHQACSCNSQSANQNTTLSRKKKKIPWKQTTRKSNKQTNKGFIREKERDVNLCVVGCEI